MTFLSAEYRLSERTACKLLDVERSSYRYEPRPDRNAALRDDLVKLARQKLRYGYRRLHALLSGRGHEVNVKRVYLTFTPARLYAIHVFSIAFRLGHFHAHPAYPPLCVAHRHCYLSADLHRRLPDAQGPKSGAGSVRRGSRTRFDDGHPHRRLI
mgnify:CR=1 FL=1